jgi:hypothetical protein
MVPRPRFRPLALLGAVALLSAVSAKGSPALAADTDWQNAVATRRSGFTAGLVLGAALGYASGTPNDYGAIGNPAYTSHTGGFGSGGALWLGGALTDWFTFGLGGQMTSFGGSKLSSKSTAFLFHIEAFPLFYRGGVWRDLGAFADFGTGVGSIARKSTGEDVASAGTFSVAGVGAFWETWRLAGLTAGPVISWHYEYSHPLERHYVVAGLRGAFYGGP